MTRFILVTGGKGGVAKTTTTVSLGCALASLGSDVTVLDANLTTPNVGIYLGSPTVPISLHEVLQGKHHISEAVYMHPSGLKVVPASINLETLKKTSPTKLKDVVKGLKGVTDVVLIDSAAGLGREALLALDASEEVLIVTHAEMSSLADALKVIHVAKDMKKKVLGVVVTRHRNATDEVSIDNVEAILESKVVAIIPESSEVKESHAMRDNVVFTHPSSLAALKYKQLAAEISGMSYTPDEPIMPKIPKVSRFSRVMRFFGIH